jgi:hypothetical protein
MVSKEEQELIDLRMKWADMPILNFWHDTNDAPDTFFDELLDESRGDVTTETKAKRTTTRSKSSGKKEEKATSSYDGPGAGGAKIKYKITDKGWGKFWKYVLEVCEPERCNQTFGRQVRSVSQSGGQKGWFGMRKHGRD